MPLVTTTVLDGLAFPEGPRWHGDRLWFSDQHTGWVSAMTPDGTAERVVEVGGGPSGLGWLPDGRLLVVSMRDRRLLRLEPDGTLVEHADLAALAPFHCNDMVVDVQGRAYVGNFGFDLDGGGAFATTVLVRVDPDGTAIVAADDLAFPNGALITTDGTTLIVGETFAGRLSAFTVQPDGALSDRRIWAEVGGAPDGSCLDAEGAVWVADPMGRRVVRVLEGGEITDEVRVGDPNSAYACMLGGPDRRTLYVCSAPTSTPELALAAMGGRIEAVTVDVPGAGLP